MPRAQTHVADALHGGPPRGGGLRRGLPPGRVLREPRQPAGAPRLHRPQRPRRVERPAQGLGREERHQGHHREGRGVERLADRDPVPALGDRAVARVGVEGHVGLHLRVRHLGRGGVDVLLQEHVRDGVGSAAFAGAGVVPADHLPGVQLHDRVRARAIGGAGDGEGVRGGAVVPAAPRQRALALARRRVRDLPEHAEELEVGRLRAHQRPRRGREAARTRRACDARASGGAKSARGGGATAELGRARAGGGATGADIDRARGGRRATAPRDG